jgi:DNA primase (EC 2.7.7.-)
MNDSDKYLIHAAITADGIVERSDVVGAIFGQTEGLLGDELDLRDLQQSSKVGRIDADIDSQNGQSFGEVTIASSLDRVQTAILAASLETITRVGPCDATVEVTNIEDVRRAKRRAVVERAKELLVESFDESVMTSSEILEEVKESVRIEEIDEYGGLPAGPHVSDSDAVIIVEGRADVLTLLQYGIKNAVGVEGTNIPDPIAKLTHDRTTTAFFDGDRGGNLILRELTQVGDVDYVAFAPEDKSVEDLERAAVFDVLRGKTSIDAVEVDSGQKADRDSRVANTGNTDIDLKTESGNSEESSSGTKVTDGEGKMRSNSISASEYRTDRSVDSDVGQKKSSDVETNNRPEVGINPNNVEEHDNDQQLSAVHDGSQVQSESIPTNSGAIANDLSGVDNASSGIKPSQSPNEPGGRNKTETNIDADVSQSDITKDSVSNSQSDIESQPDTPAEESREVDSLRDHARIVVGGNTGRVRLVDEEYTTLAEAPVTTAVDTVETADVVPHGVIADGDVTQSLLDVASQRGVKQIIAASTGEFVKRPVGLQLRTADEFLDSGADI